MKMKIFMCLKLFPLLFVLFSSSFSGALIKVPENATIPAVMFFGDSVVDTGNNNYITTLVRANFLPYGKDFIAGQPTGRFSNGKVPPDLFVEELGIKPCLPPYLDPSLVDEDLLTGVNFASGGSGYDPLTSNTMSVFSLSDQLEMFEEYIIKLKKIAGDEKSSYILRESLFVVVSGSNDIWNSFFNNLRQFQYDVPSYTDLLVSHVSSFAQELYRLGARRIGVFSMPAIGCMPSQITIRRIGLERKCVTEYNEIAQLFNKKLLSALTSLNAQFPQAKMVYLDFYDLPLDMISNPQKFGFKIVDKGCCGTGTFETSLLCTYACSNEDDYIFWDSFHPTEKAYRILIHQMLQENINYFICGKSLCS
ncbi:hypothetical protein ABFS82_03G073500 [Erythranthe guttata]|uniref:SGNH hydrolase-type esterase domain-containing protein n=1 Tax=Erythranthe guttata TaxID=4155 RepID=A0A022PPF6_ERYGU|nr:PREDICTED: GDSL esterase/lipase EXL3-like [Erythranthe guttata]EYU17581.1 hypothetical protein MIMGU_mgv1a008769mg [Erythranthe guttata]|eukprot:XP_012829587.1 PREDICTED: GDSL esterase/lipase EXL3-like [Erythranthe guttata]